MTPGWEPRWVSLGLGREGMEGRGEPGQGLRRAEVMGEGLGMSIVLLAAGGGWEGGRGRASSASGEIPSNEDLRNACTKHNTLLCHTITVEGGRQNIQAVNLQIAGGTNVNPSEDWLAVADICRQGKYMSSHHTARWKDCHTHLSSAQWSLPGGSCVHSYSNRQGYQSMYTVCWRRIADVVNVKPYTALVFLRIQVVVPKLDLGWAASCNLGTQQRDTG